jgi:prepilin-type N-terminal cleavage/methylation domain-containing protein
MIDRPQSARTRRGFSLIELTASVVLLAAALAMTGELVLRVAAQRRSIDRRVVALHEAGNLLERLAAAEPGDRADLPELVSAEDRLALPGGAVEVEVGPPADGLARLTVVVSWEDRPGVPAVPVRLATWVPAGEDKR